VRCKLPALFLSSSLVLSGTALASEGAEKEGAIELPNLVSLLHHCFPHQAFVQFLVHWENIFFALLAAAVLAFFGIRAAGKAKLIPGNLQNNVESIVEGLDNFIRGILGEHGREFSPFIGTLFIYIFTMNLLGTVPFLKSPTSSYGITLPLGLIVFFYVQFVGVRKLGFLKYLNHLAGEPQNIIGALLIPLMFFLHIVGELVKPLSLSLRLFGNIWGEDVLIAVFVGMGSGFFVPLHLPFLFLALLTSFVQATVFCLLTAIYISLMLPHVEESREENEKESKPGRSAGLESIHN